MAWYRIGTVSITQGSFIVTSSLDVAWSINVLPGDVFTLDGSKLYEIDHLDAVLPNTKLHLKTPFEETSVTNESYAILKFSSFEFTSLTMAQKMAEVVNKWLGRDDEIRAWQTGSEFGGYHQDGGAIIGLDDPLAGYYPMTNPFSITEYIACPAKQAALNAIDVAAIQLDADNALIAIAAISADDKLTLDEKPTVKQAYALILSEDGPIIYNATQMTGCVVEMATYSAAITTLTNYLATLTTPYLWSDVTIPNIDTGVVNYTTIVRATFNTNFENVYLARQALLDRMAFVASTKATVDSNGALVGSGGVIIDNSLLIPSINSAANSVPTVHIQSTDPNPAKGTFTRASSATLLKGSTVVAGVPRIETSLLDIPANFTRASVAYKTDGSSVTSGSPRYETGKFGNAVMVEEGTTNINLWATSSWNKRAAMTIGTVNSDGSYNITTTGADDGLLYAYPTQTNGATYTLSAEVKWISGTTNLQISTGTLNPLNSAVLTLTSSWQTIKHTGVSGVSSHVGFSRAAAGVYAIRNIQYEAKAYATSFAGVNGVRSAETLTIPTAGVLSASEGTIECWYYLNPAYSGRNRYFVAHASGGYHRIALAIDSSNLFSAYTMNGSTLSSAQSSTSYNTAGWYHVAMTWNSSALILYVNGVLAGSVATPNLPTVIASSMYVGLWADGINYFCNGLLDDLRFSTRAKTAQEIASAYQATAPLPLNYRNEWLWSFDNALTGVTKPFAGAVMVEEGTTNIVGAASFQTFGASWADYSGAVVSRTAGQTDPYGGATAYRLTTTTVGTHVCKILAAIDTPGVGVLRSNFIWIKNLDTANAVRVHWNATNTYEDVIAGQGWVCVKSQNYVGNGINGNQFQLRTAAAGTNLDVLVWRHQSEAKAYCTSWTDSTPRAAETLTIPTAGVLSATEGTIECWVKKSLVGLAGGIFAAYSDANNYFNIVYLADGSVVFYHGAGVGGSTPAGLLSDTAWHHIAAVWNSTTKKIFVDGVERHSGAYSAGVLNATSYFGTNTSGYGQTNGLIDDFRISSRAKSASEILAAYKSTVPADKEAATTLLMSFDAGDIWVDTTNSLVKIYDGVNWTTTASRNAGNYGTFAQRPLVNAAGDSYYATDTKLYYFCTAAPNTWTQGASNTTTSSGDYNARPLTNCVGDTYYATDRYLMYICTAAPDTWVIGSSLGAPTGTYIAGTLAETVASNAATALANAATAQSTADGKIICYYQIDNPGAKTAADNGDLWIDTDDGNKIYAYSHGNGTNGWVVAQDTSIGTAITNAQTAQTTADGKAKVYYQTSSPTGQTASDAGDMWVDTDANNKLYIYSGSAWVLAQDWYTANATAIASASTATWSGVTGTGKPADNASADLDLTLTNVTRIGNTVTKSAGGSAWNGECRSTTGFVSGAFCSFKSGYLAFYFFAGLTEDPTASTSWDTIDYAWYCNGGNHDIVENGVSRSCSGTYTLDTVFAVIYDGNNIVYTKNGATIRTVSAIGTGKTFYFDSCLYNPSAIIADIKFSAPPSWGATAGKPSNLGGLVGTEALLNSDINISMTNGIVSLTGGPAGSVNVDSFVANKVNAGYINALHINADSLTAGVMTGNTIQTSALTTVARTAIYASDYSDAALAGEIHVWAKSDDTNVVEVASIGINTSGTDQAIAIFGTDTSKKIGMIAKSHELYGMQATSYHGIGGVFSSNESSGIYATSTHGSAIIGHTDAPAEDVTWGSAVGVYGSSDNTTSGVGVKGVCEGSSTTSAVGVWGAATAGIGVKGVATTGYAGHFTNSSTNTPTLKAENSSAFTGVHGTSTGGIGVLGYGSGSGTGVKAEGTEGKGLDALATSGYAGYFVNNSTSNATVSITNSSSGKAINAACTGGVCAEFASNGGTGLNAISNTACGLYATTGASNNRALYAYNTGGGVGVRAEGTTGYAFEGIATSGFAGYFSNSSDTNTTVYVVNSHATGASAIRAFNTSAGTPTIYGKCTGGGSGVHGHSTTGTGVYGQSDSGTAIYGDGGTGFGAHIVGSLYLAPRSTYSGTLANGNMYYDSDDNTLKIYANGSWRTIAFV